MKKCNEVMTKDPVYCLPNDAVARAAQLMKKEEYRFDPRHRKRTD
jgi:hypothetical protein